tara:strand:- start:779 stop:1504 length:726 start_codon:yes stop_codon:yes gene_type:complete
MNNLVKLSTELQKIPTNNINSVEKEVLHYILNKPKSFGSYDNNDKQKLGVYLIAISKFLGIKQPLDDIQRKLLVNTLCSEVKNFTFEELDKAIKMASMGKFAEIDNQHYQSLSPIYLSNIINAYINYRNGIYKKYRNFKENNKPEKVISKEEIIRISTNFINDEIKEYSENKEEYFESEYKVIMYKHSYNTLYKAGIIKGTELNKLDDIKSILKKFYTYILENNINVIQYMMSAYNKNEHI